MKKLFVVIFFALACLCSTGDKYDGEVVVLNNGTVVELCHNIGDTYFIKMVDSSKVVRAANLLEEKK